MGNMASHIVRSTLSSLVSPLKRARKYSQLISSPGWGHFWGGADPDTGLQVTAETSMQVSAVSSAVGLLAETVASLPIFLYQRSDDGKIKASDHPLFTIIHSSPNNFQTPYEFKQMMMAHVLLRGNAYGEIIFNNRGEVDQIIPRHPDRVQPFWVRDGVKAYRYYPLSGGSRIILADEMLQIMFFTVDGLSGLDPIANHMRTIGLSLGAEKYGARFYRNDATPSFVFEYPGSLGDKGKQNINESWNDEHKGVNRSHKHAILEEGLKIHELSITPENAQFLETRKFQVTDIARIFRVPPHMIGDLERATFNNIEQQSLDFVIFSLTPWLVKWEQAITRDLLDSTDKLRFFAEFKVDALLRGDLKSRYAAYSLARMWGWLSVNDILKIENMNGIGDQGDVYLQPLNMVNADEMRKLTNEEVKQVRMLGMRALFQQLPHDQISEIFKEDGDNNGKD